VDASWLRSEIGWGIPGPASNRLSPLLRWRSRQLGGRPRISEEIRTLIGRRSTELRGHDGQVQQGEQEVPYVGVSVGQTSGATQRCLNPGFGERIGNSRPTGADHLAPRGKGVRPSSPPPFDLGLVIPADLMIISCHRGTDRGRTVRASHRR
jgi:hypothetical protein